jgi:hypothetical protein
MGYKTKKLSFENGGGESRRGGEKERVRARMAEPDGGTGEAKSRG